MPICEEPYGKGMHRPGGLILILYQPPVVNSPNLKLVAFSPTAVQYNGKDVLKELLGRNPACWILLEIDHLTSAARGGYFNRIRS